MKALLVIATALSAGCSGVHMRSGPFGAPTPTPGVTGGIPGTTGPDGVGGPLGATQGPSRQTVCRSAGVPRGWVAVDYVSGGEKCGSDDPYNAAVLQRLAPLPQGTLLLICTGQTIPINWRRDSGSDSAGGGGQCPRNPRDTRTGPTTMTIVREQ